MDKLRYLVYERLFKIGNIIEIHHENGRVINTLFVTSIDKIDDVFTINMSDGYDEFKLRIFRPLNAPSDLIGISNVDFDFDADYINIPDINLKLELDKLYGVEHLYNQVMFQWFMAT